MNETRALILGCGYVGGRLARALAAEGIAVLATTRTAARAAEVEATGAHHAVADVMEPASLAPLVEWRPNVVFDLVRPQEIGPDEYSSWGARNVAGAFSGQPLQAIVYLSSTSVYGRRNGEETDEETPVEPTSPLGRARAACERAYLELHERDGLPARICRAPGIYGPGRTLRERLETGAYRRVDDDDRWVSRIHVDDLVAGVIAAWRRGRDGRVYLLADDEPVTSQEYAELTAKLLGLTLPPTTGRADIRDELNVSQFERRMSSRRCRNRRMHDELGIDLRFPSVREGVPAALLSEGAITEDTLDGAR